MFNKQIVISITKAEFLQLLAEKGLNVPANTPIRGGSNDWDSDIDFPITIRWEEKGTLDQASRSPRHPSVSLFHEDAINNLIRNDQIIEAIKYTRATTGWGLAASKEYVDKLAGRRP